MSEAAGYYLPIPEPVHVERTEPMERPWRIESSIIDAKRNNPPVIISAGINGYSDGPAEYVIWDKRGMNRADVEFMINAVNSYDDMVATLREALAVIAELRRDALLRACAEDGEQP